MKCSLDLLQMGGLLDQVQQLLHERALGFWKLQVIHFFQVILFVLDFCID